MNRKFSAENPRVPHGAPCGYDPRAEATFYRCLRVQDAQTGNRKSSKWKFSSANWQSEIENGIFSTCLLEDHPYNLPLGVLVGAEEVQAPWQIPGINPTLDLGTGGWLRLPYHFAQ